VGHDEPVQHLVALPVAVPKFSRGWAMGQAVRALVGRPRKPEVDERVKGAAIEIFGELGLSAVSVDAVARRSAVSKRSIYLRWANKEDLLSEALTEQLQLVSDLDTGDLRNDLLSMARQLVELYAGPAGKAALRLAVDPNLGAFGTAQESLRESQVLAARALVHRAVARGDLPPGTSVTVLLDAICGAALNHVLGTPTRMRPMIRKQAPKYAAELVDFVMRALVFEGSPTS